MATALAAAHAHERQETERSAATAVVHATAEDLKEAAGVSERLMPTAVV